jgi:hypothetical protein
VSTSNEIELPRQIKDLLFNNLTDNYTSSFLKILNIIPDGMKFEQRPT